MHPDDAETVRGVLARDEATFEALVRATHPLLVAVARRILHDDAAAEDVAQETWRRVLLSIGKFEGKSRLSSWIVQIAKNRARTRLAAAKREPLVLDDAPEPTAAWFDAFGQWHESPRGPDDGLERDARKKLLAIALDALPERQRAVVVLRDVEGLDAATASETLGISAENQRVLLHRARVALREAIVRAARTL